MTPLDKSLKRSINIKGLDYVITLTPESLKLTRKGRRIGMELKWPDLISGESALAVALHASVGQFEVGNKEASNASGDDAPSTRTKAPRRNDRRAPQHSPKRAR
jgi:hypothetical protein